MGCSSLQDSLKLGPVQLPFSFEICSCAKVFELLSYAFCCISSSLTSQFSCLHQFCAKVQLLLMSDVKFSNSPFINRVPIVVFGSSCFFTWVDTI